MNLPLDQLAPALVWLDILSRETLAAELNVGPEGFTTEEEVSLNGLPARVRVERARELALVPGVEGLALAPGAGALQICATPPSTKSSIPLT